MIKGIAEDANGRKLLIVGLAWSDLDALRASLAKGSIMVEGGDLGLPLDVMILAGKDDVQIDGVLTEALGHVTTMYRSRRQ